GGEILLCQDMRLKLLDHERFKPFFPDEPSITHRFPTFGVVMAGIVKKLRGFFCTPKQCGAALSTVEEAAEEIITVDRTRVGLLGTTLTQNLLYSLERLSVNDGRMAVFDMDSVLCALGPVTPIATVLSIPHQITGVFLIFEDVIDVA